MRFLLVKIFVFVFSFAALSVYADDCFPPRPTQAPFLVHDNTNTLTREQILSLENLLVQFNNETSNQFVIVITGDLCGMDPAMYATDIIHKWGVGDEKKDNGLAIVVKPTGGKGERKYWIATGYGLEGALPDATIRMIEENEMLPSFKEGNIYSGLVKTLNVLMPIAKGEYNEAAYKEKVNKMQYGKIAIILFVLGVFILFRLLAACSYARTNHTSLWTALWLMTMTGGSRRGGGGWDDFSSGGGGFGGFGGGSSGGGGAGGNW